MGDSGAAHSRLTGTRATYNLVSMSWPNNPSWSAGRHENAVTTDRGEMFTWVVDCGSLYVPSGKLVACDPFAFMQARNNPHLIIPAGRYPVTVTLADVSEKLDRSHIREAYASVLIKDGREAYRRTLPLAKEGEALPELKDDEYVGFRVDAGTACFVDDSAISAGMPDPKNWLPELFENERSDSWFNRMDDPNHIREGIANIVLPLAKNGENLVLFHSGWGDGVYPVVGSYDDADVLLAVHIDFSVVP
jgi:hypothetical protein